MSSTKWADNGDVGPLTTEGFICGETESILTESPPKLQARRGGQTRLYELIAAGELDSFLDGRSRKITVESIYRYVRQRLEETQGARAKDTSGGSAP
jgi:hypothetical protein